jgi:hypothetical protein
MPTVENIIARRKKALEAGSTVSYSAPKARTIDDVLRDRGYKSPESIQSVSDAQERSIAPIVPVMERMTYNNDAIEAKRLKSVASAPKASAQPVKVEQPQIPYTDLRWQNYKVPETKPIQTTPAPILYPAPIPKAVATGTVNASSGDKACGPI